MITCPKSLIYKIILHTTAACGSHDDAFRKVNVNWLTPSHADGFTGTYDADDVEVNCSVILAHEHTKAMWGPPNSAEASCTVNSYYVFVILTKHGNSDSRRHILVGHDV